ncbi:MAG: hypothetical protein ACR2M1_04140 [Gemmatimonadaceae bacterium]
MAINYVIGIGGTGARVIEALVHCCAAGLGPDRLNIFLIDPDEGNGNLSRTKNLITAYQDCHRIYREHSANPQQLFKTDIRKQQLAWGILEKQNARLDDYIHYDSLPEDMQSLVTLLFSPDERDRELNEGFRGHPSIGAAVMANAEDKGPWQTFWQDVSNAQGEGSVRAFLIGSVFGGTGAAGIPTFGSPQMLKLREKKAKLDEAGSSKIRLGAALVLPYFLFDMNSEATARAETELCVTPSDFPIATKVALEYYDTKPLAFDDMYLIGDDGERKVGNFSPGSRSQDNRPHYVELVTALAAFDFLRAPDAPSSIEPFYFIAGRNSDVVDWRALPVSRDESKLVELQNAVKHAIVTMAVFSYGFATYGAANFETKPSSVLHAWYLDRFSNQPNARGKAYIDEATKVDLRVVAEYAQTFLKWLAQLDGEDGRLALVRGDRLGVDLSGATAAFVGKSDPQDSRIPVLLKSGSDAGDDDVTSRASKSDDLASALSKEGGDDPSASAAARYIDLFYRAASRFTESEFRISSTVKGA